MATFLQDSTEQISSSATDCIVLSRAVQPIVLDKSDNLLKEQIICPNVPCLLLRSDVCKARGAEARLITDANDENLTGKGSHSSNKKRSN